MVDESRADAGTQGRSSGAPPAERDPVALSGTYLAATRRGEGAAAHRSALATLDPEALTRALADDDRRLAFWLNVYNAVVQDRLALDPDAFEDRRAFFGGDWLTVAGRDLSLDFVENRLLRRSRWKYGGGYVPVPRPGAFERRFRVDELDPRIHFALNCGAASCPPVRGYDPADIDAQLDEMTRSYLGATVEYEPGGRLFDGVARVPRLFLWFRGDWGRRPDIVRFLRRYDLLPPGVRPRLSYLPYDWSLKVGHFADGTE